MQTESNNYQIPTPLMSGSTMGSGTLTYATDSQWLQEQADQLRQVAMQMDTFLVRQLDRLQRHLALGASCNQQEFAEIQASFAKMKLQWEEERQQEKQNLLEDAQRLADAWQRLEQEQREILKQRASFKSTSASSAGGATAVPVADHDPSLQPGRVEVKTKAAPVAFAADTMLPAGSSKNQLQFQQLRREMLEHSRQHRKR